MGSIPNALLDTLENKAGFNRDSFINVHKSGDQIVSIRFNPKKKTNPAQWNFDISSKVPWSTDGYYLLSRPSFTLDPYFHSGAYYVQEASSMFLEQVLSSCIDLSRPIKVLDACAAPGGKSTLIQSLITEDSLLVSNEVIKTRVSVLIENITKWGALNTIVTNNDPSEFSTLSDFFDVVVADAPCSGSGLFRKDPESIKEWSPENVEHCSLRQRRILTDVIPALKENGLLVYSTCSYSSLENEDVLDWLMASGEFESVRVPAQNFTGIVETMSVKNNAYGYRFYPDRLRGEGFFIAAFRKKKKSGNPMGREKKKHLLDIIRNAEFLSPWIEKNNSLCFFAQKEDVIAFPENNIADLESIRNKLYIKKAGINMGSQVGGDLIPSHVLAMSNLISNGLPFLDLDLMNARQYLRHQSFNYQSESKGWSLVKYGGLNLGLVKIMPGRVNNYYPRDWRILNK